MELNITVNSTWEKGFWYQIQRRGNKRQG